MADKSLRLPPLLIKRVISAKMGPDAAHFLTLVPFIKSIDNIADSRPAEELLELGDATLGTTLSPFVEHLLRPNHRDFIDQFIAREHINYDNMKEVLNLLGAQLKVIACDTRDLRGAVTSEEKRDRRLKLAHDHELLNIFASAACCINADRLAPVIQEARRIHGDDLEAINQAVCQQKFEVYRRKVNVREMGLYQQMLDDINDLFCDLRTEKEFGRIMPNAVLARLVKRGVDPDTLYEKHKEAIQQNRIIEASELDPEVREVIAEILVENREMVSLFKKDMALRGVRFDGKRFATRNEDHDDLAAPKELRIRGQQGLMRWGERVQVLTGRERT